MNKFLLLIFSFCVSNLTAQLSELNLDPSKVIIGATHYKLPNGNQTYPGALVNDTFSYNPNNPIATAPFQGWKNYPDYSYVFMLPEKESERNWEDFSFPQESVDSNFLAVNFAIPEGKSIAFLDCWGQSDLTVSNNTKDIVIILKDSLNHWCFLDWDDVQPYSSESKAYARFDFKTAGVTDNLLRNATQLALCRLRRGPGTEFRFRVAEIRIALEEDPHIGDIIPPQLIGASTRELLHVFEISGAYNESGTVYLLPQGNYNSASEVQKAAIYRSTIEKNTEFTIYLPDMSSGIFNIVCLDGAGNLSALSDDIVFTQKPLSGKANIEYIELLLSNTVSTEIDTMNTIVSIILAEGSDLSRLFTYLEISEGATTEFISNKYVDYSDTVHLDIISEDVLTTNNWRIAVSILEGIEDDTVLQDSALYSITSVADPDFILYPTRVNENLHIITEVENYKLQLFSSNGKLLIEQRNCNRINLQHLSFGIYYVRISYNNKLYVQKIIKR